MLIFALTLPCFTAAELPYLIDDADLLSEDEELYLLANIEKIVIGYGYDIVIHTTQSTNGQDIISYCDDYYDNGGYSEDGLIFVISMDERDYYTSTSGTLVDSLPSYEIDSICADAVPFLSQGAYCDAFSTYLQNLSDYFAGGYSSDTHYDESSDYNQYESDSFDIDYLIDPLSDFLYDFFYKELAVVIVACLIAFLITKLIKSRMNTAVKQSDADNYVIKGTFTVSGSRDLFICSSVNRTPISKSNTSSGGSSHRSSGGGSSHTSSGGTRHGGSGGKF